MVELWGSIADNFYYFWRVALDLTNGYSLLLLVVVLFWPLEEFFPRLSPTKRVAGKAAVIIILTAISVMVAQVYTRWGQQSLISILVPLKLFSLSKMPIPDWLLILVSMLLLDFVYYLSHLISHYVKPIWQLHKIHHADEHVTALSSLLHHPFESLYTAFVVTGFAVLVGMPILVYVYFGLALAIHAVWAHANLVLPDAIDKKLRLLVVTPDVHRTHHSQNMREGNSNFGALFTVWDRLFGTYTDRPQLSEQHLLMGLPEGAKPKAFSVKELLFFPFR